jgi:hypothetical protein
MSATDWIPPKTELVEEDCPDCGRPTIRAMRYSGACDDEERVDAMPVNGLIYHELFVAGYTPMTLLRTSRI